MQHFPFYPGSAKTYVGCGGNLNFHLMDGWMDSVVS